MCQAYEGERNYLMQKDAKDARATLSAMQEDARRLARYDEAKALITELSGALIALHAIVEEEGGSLLLSCPLTDKRARKVYAEACDFLAAEGKVAG